MLRKARIMFAIIFLTCITLLFLDFTGTAHTWLGWMAKIQFLPALLAMNAGAILFLLLLTFVFGRIYCSVICPLGVFQDVAAWLGKRPRKRRKAPYRYSPAKSRLRYGVLLLFIVAFVAGASSLVALLAPYSAYGRIAGNLFQPVWMWGNNLLAGLAERSGSYAFYQTDVWIKSLPTFLIAAATLILIVILAWRGGRTYCNTICPVGTLLGMAARYSWFRPVIDTEKCNGCGLCSRHCKAACIDSKAHAIDYSRCVTCMDCIGQCRQGAISYRHRKSKATDATTQDGQSRRSFLTAGIMVATATTLKAQEKKVDGGLAIIQDKEVPKRLTAITPPGSVSASHFARHCTGCQLCVSACPNGVLRPSTDLMKLMQPEMGYERGYCRPECTKCSEVCPAGAILRLGREDKSSVQIGHAVWVRKNCIPLTDDVECGNCARHCPTGAIQMVYSIPGNESSPRIPVVNTERCIGCGACENLCPARPFSAIYVEGHSRHRTL